MILNASLFHGLRAPLLVLTIASAALPVGYAAAKNHDIQAIRLPPASPVPHDRAPGPADRG